MPSPDPGTVHNAWFSEAAEKAFSNWMQEVSRTEHEELQRKLLNQAVGAVRDFVGQELKPYDCIATALLGIRPKHELEGMLAVRNGSPHTRAMECLKRAALPNQIDLRVEVNVSLGAKLMRTFPSLRSGEPLPGKGEQNMIVEHVTLTKGDW